MFRWCSYCQTFVGETEPYNDFEVTHGICSKCKDRKANSNVAGVLAIKPLAKFFERVRIAAQNGSSIDPAALLNESEKLGIKGFDFFMGMIQPILWEIGNLYEKGEITVPQEHQFTAVAERLLSLIESRLTGATETQLKTPPSKERVDVLLTCVDQNYHTVGIRALNVGLMQRGFHTAVFYPSLPDQAIVDLCKHLKPTILGITAGLLEHHSAVKSLVNAVETSGLRDHLILAIGGQGIESLGKPLKSKFDFVADPRRLEEFYEFVGRAVESARTAKQLSA